MYYYKSEMSIKDCHYQILNKRHLSGTNWDLLTSYQSGRRARCVSSLSNHRYKESSTNAREIKLDNVEYYQSLLACLTTDILLQECLDLEFYLSLSLIIGIKILITTNNFNDLCLKLFKYTQDQLWKNIIIFPR